MTDEVKTQRFKVQESVVKRWRVIDTRSGFTVKLCGDQSLANDVADDLNRAADIAANLTPHKATN